MKRLKKSPDKRSMGSKLGTPEFAIVIPLTPFMVRKVNRVESGRKYGCEMART